MIVIVPLSTPYIMNASSLSKDSSSMNTTIYLHTFTNGMSFSLFAQPNQLDKNWMHMGL
jgi:hypothetical protein